MPELKSRSQMRRIACQNPELLIEEIEQLRKSLKNLEAEISKRNKRLVELGKDNHRLKARVKELESYLLSEQKKKDLSK